MADEPQVAALVEGAGEGTPPEGQTQEPTPQENWQAKYTALAQEHQATQQRLASIQGSATKQAERDALVVRLNDQMEAMMEHLSDPEADPRSLARKREELKAKDQKDLAKARAKHLEQGYLSSIATLLIDAGMDSQDPRLVSSKETWKQASDTGDTNLMAQALLEVHAVTAEAVKGKTKAEVAAAKKEAEDARKRFNADNGALEAGMGGGSPAPAGKRNYTRDEISKMTPEEYAAARSNFWKQ